MNNETVKQKIIYWTWTKLSKWLWHNGYGKFWLSNYIMSLPLPDNKK